MKKLLSKISIKGLRTFFFAHKAVSVLIAISLLSAFYSTAKAGSAVSKETHYVLGTVTRGTVVASVTSTGQVSASSQIDVKSKVSGDITAIYAKSGDAVSAGTLLAQVDSRDAQLSLESAQVAYNKLVEPADSQDVAKAFNDGWNAVASVFTDYPDVINGMDNLLYETNGYLSIVNPNQTNNTTARAYIQNAGASFDQAKRQYQVVLQEYNSLSRQSATSSIELLMSDTANIVKMLADSIKNAQSAISYISDVLSDTGKNETTAATNVNTWLNLINGHLSSVLSTGTALQNLLKGPDALDIQAQALSLKQKQYSYDDYFIRAPFAGTVARVPVKVGDPSSGAIIATVISSQRLATVSLNEVDVSKIKVGDKATLTFDAVPGLTTTGTVSNLDLVGTVSQGVVTYNAEIAFDTEDVRVKPGMSVSAAIVSDVKEDTLVVPSSALKTQSGATYVNVFTPAMADTGGNQGIVSPLPPTQVAVMVGLSSDTQVEILSGLSEGEQIVTRIVNPSTTTTTTQAPSLFGGGGGARGGAGAVRIGR